jgi:hypothetical protein
MSRIERLTDVQIAQMAEYAARWTELGLCTDPADRPRAEAAIREMYQQGGLEPPGKIVWCGSPLSQGLTRAVVLRLVLAGIVDRKLMGEIGDNVRTRVASSIVRDSVWASVSDSVWASGGAIVRNSVEGIVSDSVRDSVASGIVSDSVWASVRDSIEYSLSDSVGHSVRDSVWNRVRDSVRNSVEGSVSDSVRESVWASFRDSSDDGFWDSVYSYTPHDADWLAEYRYFHDVCGLAGETKRLSGLWELAQSAGWALPHQHICWVSERHNIVQRDGRGRLHCNNGPALAYPDGWAIYAIHGVRVRGEVIERPETITTAAIDRERNAEVRRVMIERYRHGEEVSGAAAYFRDAGGERLDHDERYGTLWERNVPGDEPIVMVEVVNSTAEPDGSRKRYWLRVPPEMQTAREAVAWTFGLSEREYDPTTET